MKNFNAALSLRMQIPEDFINQMRGLIPDEADSFLEAMSMPPAVSIKLNRRKPVDAGIILKSFEDDGALADCNALDRVAWCTSGLYLPVRPSFTLNPLMHAGCFYVQDASSMIYERLAAHALDILGNATPLRVLDMCAAPGGKTSSMINAMPDGTLFVANEINPQRARILKENMAKWGCPDLIVTSSDTKAFTRTPALFDLIAVDAPCSGEGMMRKEEIARSQWSPGLIRQCAALQRDILANAYEALRPGGIIIYSTCTFNTEENEEMVKWFAGEFGMVPLQLPDDAVTAARSSLDADIPALRFMPHVTRGEGLFAAMLRKPDDTGFHNGAVIMEGGNGRTRKEGKRKGNGNPAVDASALLQSVTAPGMTAQSRNESVSLLSQALSRLGDTLSKNCRIISCGVNAATLKGKNILPETELALSTVYNQDAYPGVDVDRATALRFLRHEALPGYPDLPQGCIAIRYCGIPLGFVKNLGNRSNNLYNKDWKIRNL